MNENEGICFHSVTSLISLFTLDSSDFRKNRNLFYHPCTFAFSAPQSQAADCEHHWDRHLNGFGVLLWVFAFVLIFYFIWDYSQLTMLG